MWLIIDTGIASAEKNMQLDAELLESLSCTSEKAILHLYDWQQPSATYGYFTNPLNFLSEKGIAETGLQLARRSTGGGIVFHFSDFAFSMLVPARHPAYSLNTLNNYAFVNKIIIDVIKYFTGAKPFLLPSEPASNNKHTANFCMAKPTKYDVIIDGRKVGGGAQRRTKNGFLHQGTISLAMPSHSFLKQVLLPNTGVFEAMRANTGVLLEGELNLQQISAARQGVREIFIRLLGL